MKFKERHMALEFEAAPPVLKAICLDLADYCQNHFSKELTVTRILEPVEGESGVHTLHRAVDFRDEFQGISTFTKPEQETITDYINTKYKYGSGKQVLIFHSFQGGPMHIHVQIPQKWMDEGKIS